MKITDIRLQNFRSYSDSSFEISPGVTIVVGPNAVGKTNLIEAVMLVCTSKTYRSHKKLVKDKTNWSRIDAHTNKNQQRTVKIVKNNETQTISVEIDKKPYTKLTTNVRVPIVLFEPNHLFLLHGDPRYRRAYLDDLIEQIDSTFGKVRANYQRSLIQRNRLLKQGVNDKNLLFAWNVRLIEDAAKIVTERKKTIKDINTKLDGVYKTVSKKNHQVSATYVCNVEGSDYANGLMKKFEVELERDLARGHTHGGPHRDDFFCNIDGNKAEQVSSRGEIRTLILALKIIELDVLESQSGQAPLLLLDDVFSELDGARRQSLVELIQEHQTIITTTDADIVTKNFSQNCQIIVLS